MNFYHKVHNIEMEKQMFHLGKRIQSAQACGPRLNLQPTVSYYE